MFNSAILDVVIGLVFTFMGVSLAASAVTEAIGSAFKLRQTTLRQGIQALVNDKDFTGLARDLYNHTVLNPLASGKADTVRQLSQQPAYIETRQFSIAFLDILDAGTGGQPLAATIAAIPDAQLRGALTALLAQADGDAAKFEAAVGAWFDAAMDRLSGWYKRDTQAIAFAAALAICVILNADAFHLAEAIWHRPALVSELGVRPTVLPSPTDAIGLLDKATLIGWVDWDVDGRRSSPFGLTWMVLGWLTVAAASLFGAPFWFDTLQRIVQVRGTGDTARDAAGARPARRRGDAR